MYLSKATLWPVRGTHEEDAVLYRALFDLPNNELYYSFDYGNAHFIVLDTENQEGQPAMLEWLKRDLAGNHSDWTFVFYHTPTFNVGGHGSTWGRDDFLPVLEAYGVDFVITGHSHIYERFLPIGPAGKKPVIHIVSGGGGAPLYAVQPSPILAGGIGSSELHYCAFEVNGNTCRMVVKRPDGSVLDRLSLVKRDGLFQPEVQAQAVTTEAAEALTFAFADVKADFPAIPAPGQEVQVTLAARRMPEGSSVAIRQASGEKAWRVSAGEQRQAQEKLTFTVRTPQDLRPTSSGLEPPLRIAMRLSYEGRSYAADNIAVGVTDDTLRKLIPAPQPVTVAHLAQPVALDGDLADWADVAPMPLPFQKAQTSSFRLVWREDGLYGAVEAADDALAVNPAEPWATDTVEIFVEKDAARSLGRTANTAQYALSPAPDTGPGPAHVLTAYGDQGRQSGIQCTWRPVRGGYVLEFFIPAATLEPAKMAAGSVLGLNFARSDHGVPVEQFYCDKNPDGWQKPILWGAVRLVE